MKRLLLSIIPLLTLIIISNIIHELFHLLQIFAYSGIEYVSWGIEPFKSWRPVGFYFEVYTEVPTFWIEVQAYGIQILFLILILLKDRKFNFNWRQKCVSC